MKEKVREAEEIFIEGLEKTFRFYGMNEIYGRLYGILFFEDLISLQELSERSGYALSTVSTSIRELERWKLVKRKKIAGDRKIYYVAERDWIEIMKQLLRMGLNGEVRIMTNTIDKGLKILEKMDDERAKRDVEYLKELKELYNMATILIKTLLEMDEKQFLKAFKNILG